LQFQLKKIFGSGFLYYIKLSGQAKKNHKTLQVCFHLFWLSVAGFLPIKNVPQAPNSFGLSNGQFTHNQANQSSKEVSTQLSSC
jgi:hypothetical protein